MLLSKSTSLNLWLALCASALTSCSAPPAKITQLPKEVKSAAISATPVVKKPRKQQKILLTKSHKINHNNITFNILTYDSRSNYLEVADQSAGPGSLWRDSETAAKSKAGIAAINAGFFTPEGKPLGLIIDDGVKRGSFNKSSLGAGIYYTTDSGAKIARSRHWSIISKTKPKYLLQSGPMLVELSSPVKGLSTKSSRVRSFIATDNANHWIIGHASECTLDELAKALNTIKIPNFTLKTALNLDGGRSSDLWVAASVTGGPKTVRAFWNKSVRNFLVLKKK